jgi:signal transduction histidine kinase
LPQRIIQAQENERERISRDIHDDLGQSLVTFKILLQSVLLSAESMPKKKDIDKIIKDIDKIIEKTRHLTSTLRPSTLEVLGMTTALKVLIEEFKQKNLTIKFNYGLLDSVSFEGDPINFYRVIQESLTNIVKHAKATKVNIDIQLTANRLTLTIEDDGHGFLKDSERGTQGLGLSTMQERALLLKGNLEIKSNLDKGTMVNLNVPIKRST